jgi:outer membrane murein-binding lipoprotein Lpp
MSSERFTNVELAEKHFPGIRAFVDLSLDNGDKAIQVAVAVREKFPGSGLTKRMIQHYRASRWRVERRALREERRHIRAKAQEIGERGLDEAAQSELWDAVDAMSPQQLLALRRIETDRARLLVEKQEADIKAREAETRARELEAKIEALKRERECEQAKIKGAVAAAAAAEDRAKATDELIRQVDEIYGTFQEASVATLPSQVGG